MAKATLRKAPTGSSNKMDLNKAVPKLGLGKLHTGGKTVPTWQAGRLDKMTEATVPSVPT
jgi:hypothetical protein